MKPVMQKTIIFTGGGSGGHTVPAFTLIKLLRQRAPDIKIAYIGSKNGLENKIANQENVQFFAISTGKLRRYLSIENFKDLFRIAKGFFEAFSVLKKIDSANALLFSTGGFVSVPAVIASWCVGIPIYIHEQTTRVGLANKIASWFAEKVLISFAESAQFFNPEKVLFSGYPLRAEIFQKLNACVVEDINLQKVDKKIIFITGGGNGAKLLNDLVLRIRENVQADYFIVHQVGNKFIKDFKPLRNANYLPVEFVNCMPEVLKIADVVISRAGAGTVYELIMLKKRSIFVPLKIAQKNEQYHNAAQAKELLGSIIVNEDDVDQADWIGLIKQIDSQKRLEGSKEENPADKIVKLVLERVQV